MWKLSAYLSKRDKVWDEESAAHRLQKGVRRPFSIISFEYNAGLTTDILPFFIITELQYINQAGNLHIRYAATNVEHNYS